ncbi:MAG: Stp1/IreP family PP2C-type Ser/Thr phosphatase [Clostridia bacterium]|nr:Stp1/IreP family PP2C-type Ser/Thr phosphatase [Clostridia bacterium]
MRIGAMTDIGRYRKLNEDSYFIYRNELLVGGMVADGMGGHNAGEIASKMAAELIKSGIMDGFYPDMDYMEFSELVRRVFQEVNEEIYRMSKVSRNNTGMGTTATAAFVYRGKLITVNVGDSRVYAVKDKEIKQLTKDHSYVEELVEMGEISPEVAKNHPQRNYITRALGTEAFVKSDILINDYNGEIIVICSDGLTNMLADSQIADIVTENEDFENAAKALVKLANQKGGADNITCVVFEV